MLSINLDTVLQYEKYCKDQSEYYSDLGNEELAKWFDHKLSGVYELLVWSELEGSRRSES